VSSGCAGALKGYAGAPTRSLEAQFATLQSDLSTRTGALKRVLEQDLPALNVLTAAEAGALAVRPNTKP
jgi:hypothetical protein